MIGIYVWTGDTGSTIDYVFETNCKDADCVNSMLQGADYLRNAEWSDFFESEFEAVATEMFENNGYTISFPNWEMFSRTYGGVMDKFKEV